MSVLLFYFFVIKIYAFVLLSECLIKNILSSNLVKLNLTIFATYLFIYFMILGCILYQKKPV